MDHLRIQINEALTFEHYEDAAKMQVTLDAVLQLFNRSHRAVDGLRREGDWICFSRLHRLANNRGDIWFSNVDRAHVRNLNQYI